MGRGEFIIILEIEVPVIFHRAAFRSPFVKNNRCSASQAISSLSASMIFSFLTLPVA